MVLVLGILMVMGVVKGLIRATRLTVGCVRRGVKEEGQRRGKGGDDDDDDYGDDQHDAHATTIGMDVDLLVVLSPIYVFGWMRGLLMGELHTLLVVDS